MTAITVASSEFEDTVILSNSATTNYINTTQLTFGRSGGNRYNIILQLELAKRPRFIPYLGGSGNAAANIGYTAESAFSSRTAFLALPGEAFISQIDPAITVDMAGVTYNKANSGLNWTTAGALDDLVDETPENFTFDQTSANQDFDIRLSARYTRRALFGKINIIFYNNDADDVTTLFSSQETSGNAAEIILRGRYATRNRENGVRSRKYAVR